VTNTSETTENTTEEDNTEQVEGDFADKFSTEDEELREEIDGYDLTMAHERALVDTYESFTVDGEVDWDGQFYWDEGHSPFGVQKMQTDSFTTNAYLTRLVSRCGRTSSPLVLMSQSASRPITELGR